MILDADAMLPLQIPISCLSCRRCLDVRTRSFLDWVDVSESIPASAQSLVHVSTIPLGVLLRRSCAVPCILKRIVDACGPKKIGVDDGDMTSDGTDGNLHSACLTLYLTAATRAVAHHLSPVGFHSTNHPHLHHGSTVYALESSTPYNGDEQHPNPSNILLVPRCNISYRLILVLVKVVEPEVLGRIQEPRRPTPLRFKRIHFLKQLVR